MLDALATFADHIAIALDAVKSAGMVVAIVITAGILAAVGGMVETSLRLYGAIVGGMIMNFVVKAEDGGYAAALAAMLLTTALAFALGSTPFLIALLRRVRR